MPRKFKSDKQRKAAMARMRARGPAPRPAPQRVQRTPEQAHEAGEHDWESDVECSRCKQLFPSSQGPQDEDVLAALDRASPGGKAPEKAVDALTTYTDAYTGHVDVDGFLWALRDEGRLTPEIEHQVRSLED